MREWGGLCEVFLRFLLSLRGAEAQASSGDVPFGIFLACILGGLASIEPIFPTICSITPFFTAQLITPINTLSLDNPPSGVPWAALSSIRSLIVSLSGCVIVFFMMWIVNLIHFWRFCNIMLTKLAVVVELSHPRLLLP